ncbi:MAG: phosphoadenosine phosphosulfate reductase family protein [Bacteroidota bacterium]
MKKTREQEYQELLARPFSISKNVLHVIQWSGGKDSSALLVWALENLPRDRLKFIFCDTGWESPITYQFIQKINERLLDNQLIILKSSKYNGLLDLAKKKQRFPSTKARFCTEQLKIYPFIEWVLQQSEDIAVYQGIRSAESISRSRMKVSDDYFKPYILYQENPFQLDGTKKPKPILYKQVCEWIEEYDCSVERPFFHWKTADIIALCKKNQLLNPLYEIGFSRVGCFPCIMERKEGIRKLAEQFPERIDLIARAEQTFDSTFFGYSKVPDSQCLKPNIRDVVKWANGDLTESDGNNHSCMSHFQACE